MLSSFNNKNIITFYDKNTTSEDFEKIHKVVFHGISDNLASLFQYVKYTAMNATDNTEFGKLCGEVCIKCLHITGGKYM